MPPSRGYQPSISPFKRSASWYSSAMRRIFAANPSAPPLASCSASILSSLGSAFSTGSVGCCANAGVPMSTAAPSATAIAFSPHDPRKVIWSELPYALTLEQEPCRGQTQQDAVDRQNGRGRRQRRRVAAGKAAERHPAPERHHVDAHHAAAHLVWRDELHQRREQRKHHHHADAAPEQQHPVDPDEPRDGEQHHERAKRELQNKNGFAHSLELAEPGDD